MVISFQLAMLKIWNPKSKILPSKAMRWDKVHRHLLHTVCLNCNQYLLDRDIEDKICQPLYCFCLESREMMHLENRDQMWWILCREMVSMREFGDIHEIARRYTYGCRYWWSFSVFHHTFYMVSFITHNTSTNLLTENSNLLERTPFPHCVDWKVFQ